MATSYYTSMFAYSCVCKNTSFPPIILFKIIETRMFINFIVYQYVYMKLCLLKCLFVFYCYIPGSLLRRQFVVSRSEIGGLNTLNHKYVHGWSLLSYGSSTNRCSMNHAALLLVPLIVQETAVMLSRLVKIVGQGLWTLVRMSWSELSVDYLTQLWFPDHIDAQSAMGYVFVVEWLLSKQSSYYRKQVFCSFPDIS